MRRVAVLGLSMLVLLGVAASLLIDFSTDDAAPLPSEDELRRQGFAVWPEDTVSEAMEACAEAESWSLDPKETAFRFAREVLRYPAPRMNSDPIDDLFPGFRYLIGSDGVRGVFLGSVVDVRKYDRCWFVVGVSPREGGFPTNRLFVHRSGRPHLAINSTGERTQVGYGPLEESIVGGKQVLFDLTSLEPGATGHVISLSCRRVCDASASPLGFVPEIATTEVVPLSLDVLARTRACRTGHFRYLRQALVNLYAATVEKPIEISRGKPKVGNVLIRSQRQLQRLGIEPLGRGRWGYQVDGTNLVAQVVRLRDLCWSIASIDDPNTDVLRSLHVSTDSITFDVRWGEATSAAVGISSYRGGDYWEFDRLDGPFTVTGLVPQPLEESFVIDIELRDGPTVVSLEKTWFRTP